MTTKQKFIVVVSIIVIIILVIIFALLYSRSASTTQSTSQATSTQTISQSTSTVTDGAGVETATQTSSSSESLYNDDTENIQGIDYFINTLPISNKNYTMFYSYNDYTLYAQVNAPANSIEAGNIINDIQLLMDKYGTSLNDIEYSIIYTTN